MSPGDIDLINKALLFKRCIRVFAVSPRHRHNIIYHFIGQAEMYQFMRYLIEILDDEILDNRIYMIKSLLC